jgi:hypothetical protein
MQTEKQALDTPNSTGRSRRTMPIDPKSTQDKIIMKDHDILIATYTLQQESLRRQDEDRRAATERGNTITVELRTIAIEQAKISTEFNNFKNDYEGLTKRMDTMETKSNRIDLAIAVGAIISGLIAWFR